MSNSLRPLRCYGTIPTHPTLMLKPYLRHLRAFFISKNLPPTPARILGSFLADFFSSIPVQIWFIFSVFQASVQVHPSVSGGWAAALWPWPVFMPPPLPRPRQCQASRTGKCHSLCSHGEALVSSLPPLAFLGCPSHLLILPASPSQASSVTPQALC